MTSRPVQADETPLDETHVAEPNASSPGPRPGAEAAASGADLCDVGPGSSGHTKRRILDAAEQLFAEQGVAATSLRAILAAAGVNSAAIHYHFGSKEALIEALFSRRITPINEERLARLDRLEREGAADHESLLRAFLEPMLGSDTLLGAQGHVARGALGRLLAEAPQSFRALAEEHVSEVKWRFAHAIANASPGLGVEEAMERIEYALGAMLHAFADPVLLRDESPERGDVHRRMQRLLRFLAAGLAVAGDPGCDSDSRAPTTRLSA